ncbi:sugar ABC transporter substrate-binding protein [Streptomyces sp. NPDC001492]
MRPVIKAACAAALAAAVLTACSAKPTAAGGSMSAGRSGRHFVIDISGPLSDPFFGATKQGSDAAAKELGVKYEYSASKDANDIIAVYTRLMESAIGRKPDAIVVGDYFPDALNPLIKKATAAGIPVVVTNSGRTSWRALGAVGYVGEDPVAMGMVAGTAQAKAGVKKGLCVNQVPGNPVLEQRCKGYEKGLKAVGGSVVNLTIPSEDANNDQKVQQDIAGALRSHRDVDGVFTLGSAIAMDAVTAAKQSGRKLTIGTTDLSTNDLNAVKSGDLLFVIDQQPFLQGYYGLLIAEQYLKYKVAPTSEISTGPYLITKDNVDTVLKVGSTYPGSRGAN